MFGLLKPCAHGAVRHGIDPSAWQTHLCGLCLGLRDGHGQLARAATNTDAIVLEILTEAQQSRPSARTAAGPCALRGMRRASVVAADAPGVRLAATASLLLGAAKIRDHVDDGDAHRLARRPLARVSERWHARARAAAAPLGLEVEPLIAAIESQLRLENSPGSTLDELTAPTQLCAAELFAHTAILAGRPENAAALRAAGWHFGRIAHLADALEDLDDDRTQGRFNPLLATGTTPEQAHALVTESNSLLRAALTRVALDRVATVRWILLDPLGGVVRKLGRAADIARICATGRCRSTSANAMPLANNVPGAPFSPQPGLEPAGPDVPPSLRPSLLEGLGIIATQYCTGYACCATHTGPCSGRRKEPWYEDCDCSPGDCNCGGGHHHAAGNGCTMCDGHGCCDCNCGGCDCDCCSGGDCCDCDCCGCDCSC
ncbi:regulator [Nocardia yunnanensis]|uniref:Regulator n=1 Tax=Nocardia yunnanensis TaxID=2382165 RepID=A0A386ZEA3_9NOCA|nr:DUF5685 family protein [Nocardia yunnanensis]AYF75981.1 regulator [Nocardia yunnanensis]